ncbi:MAG: hydrogenase maturation nickel metallochaperone HypA [Deltaproteobacteria bacterium]|nr:hydrogenase maturation nickel metallochaperone HypA [Deltaproteobacteria bacterium]
MHEASLVMALFDQIDRAVAAHPRARVQEVHVRVGELAGVEPTLLRTAFEAFRESRGRPEAALALIEEPAEWACAKCGDAMARGAVLQCACGGAARLSRGGDVFLDRLELEVPDV